MLKREKKQLCIIHIICFGMLVKSIKSKLYNHFPEILSISIYWEAALVVGLCTGFLRSWNVLQWKNVLECPEMEKCPECPGISRMLFRNIFYIT